MCYNRKQSVYHKQNNPAKRLFPNNVRSNSVDNLLRWKDNTEATRLPASVVSKRSRVGSSVTTTAAAAAATVPATTTTATSPTSATTAATAVANHLLQTRIDLLLGLAKDGDEITSLLGVWKKLACYKGKGLIRKELTVSGKERNGRSLCTGTASTTNTVNIVLRVVGVVIVNHMSDITNILRITQVSKQRSHFKRHDLWTLVSRAKTKT